MVNNEIRDEVLDAVKDIKTRLSRIGSGSHAKMDYGWCVQRLLEVSDLHVKQVICLMKIEKITGLKMELANCKQISIRSQFDLEQQMRIYLKTYLKAMRNLYESLDSNKENPVRSE
jgi:hypothetical protein